jgi:hypothetical protein
MDNPEAKRANDRRLKAEPPFAQSKTLTCEPSLANDLTLKLLPAEETSITLKVETEPNRVNPMTLNAPPILAKLRSEKLLPKYACCKAETPLPNREKLRTDKLLPQ